MRRELENHLTCATFRHKKIEIRKWPNKKKGSRVTKGSGICGRKGIKGVKKGDKAFLESRTGYPAHGEVRVLKRRAGIAEETVRFKKERLDDAEQKKADKRRLICALWILQVRTEVAYLIGFLV